MHVPSWRSGSRANIHQDMQAREVKLHGLRCRPIKVTGPWKIGYALDEHTISSIPDGAGGFLTVRTEIGQLVYDLKYGRKRVNASKIARAMADWIHRKYRHHEIDYVLAAPPSERRPYQPVPSIVKRLSEILAVEDGSARLQKVRNTRSLKQLSDQSERRKELTGAFSASIDFKGRKVLIVDDLCRSGETVSEIARTLKAAGAKEVLLITATKTRVKR